MKRYYNLDENGKPLASYARNQPHVEGLLFIEAAPDEFKKWDNGWIDDVDKYLASKVEEARTVATTKWIDSNKAVTAIQANYNVFKDGNYSTIGEVDDAYNVFIAFLDL